jgi:hypothetical protein
LRADELQIANETAVTSERRDANKRNAVANFTTIDAFWNKPKKFEAGVVHRTGACGKIAHIDRSDSSSIAERMCAALRRPPTTSSENCKKNDGSSSDKAMLVGLAATNIAVSSGSASCEANTLRTRYRFVI